MAEVETKSQKRGRGGSKPGERRGGRGKGTPNKITGDLRAMIGAALAAAGGVEYLTVQAKANPSAFLTLVGKTLPKEVTGPGGAPLFEGVRFIGVEVE